MEENFAKGSEMFEGNCQGVLDHYVQCFPLSYQPLNCSAKCPFPLVFCGVGSVLGDGDEVSGMVSRWVWQGSG